VELASVRLDCDKQPAANRAGASLQRIPKKARAGEEASRPTNALARIERDGPPDRGRSCPQLVGVACTRPGRGVARLRALGSSGMGAPPSFGQSLCCASRQQQKPVDHLQVGVIGLVAWGSKAPSGHGS
jgi:hypothetical protein